MGNSTTAQPTIGYLVERLDHPGPGVLGMEAVEDEQAGDQLVPHEPLEGIGSGELDRPLQSRPVQLDHQAHDLLGGLRGTGVAGGADLAEQLLDPRADHPEVARLVRQRATPG